MGGRTKMEDMNNAEPAKKGFLERVTLLAATGLGLGYAPVAPGTVGTILGIPLALAITVLYGHIWWQVGIAAALTLIAIPICDGAEKSFGEKDDGRIVADEYMLFPICFVGQLPLCRMFAAGGVEAKQAAAFLVVAFLVARVCDILKPTPARQIQRVKGGLGVVLDDLFASFYAWILLWGLRDWLLRFVANYFG